MEKSNETMVRGGNALSTRMQDLERLYASLEYTLEHAEYKHGALEGRYANLESQMRMVMDMMSMMRQYVDVLSTRPVPPPMPMAPMPPSPPKVVAEVPVVEPVVATVKMDTVASAPKSNPAPPRRRMVA